MASVWAFIVLTLAVVPVFAQRGQITTQGKEFWLTFMKNPQSGLFADTLELSVFITTKNPCSVTVENPTTGWRNTCFMMQNTYNQIIIPVAQAYLQTPSENPVAKGIRIVATDTVSVYSANFRSASYDASNVLPISLLGNEYILQTYPPIVDIFSFEDYYSVFAIVGTENNTVVDITPSVPIVTDTLRPAGTRFSVTLGSGEVVYMRSKEINMLGDVSGTVIKARDCKKIAVFAGDELINLPSEDTGAADHVYEQVFPVATFGTQFVVTNTLYDSINSQLFNVYRITATEDTTIVSKNGLAIDTIHATQTHEYRLNGNEGSAFVETSHPSALYMYLVSNEIQGNGLGDPSMVWIPPVEQIVDDITFSTFSPQQPNYYQNPIAGTPSVHFVNIVAKTSERSNIRLDNAIVAGWQLVTGNPGYSFARKQVSHNIHRLRGADFSAFVYGLGNAVSYAYSVGSAMNRYYNFLIDSASIKDTTVKDTFFVGCEVQFVREVMFKYDTVLWDFGDGTRGGGDTVAHAFNRSDSFTVTMYVCSSNLCNADTDTLSYTIFVDTLRDTVNRTLCAGGRFDTNGRHYYFPGTYTQYLRDNVSGCRKNLVINITVTDTLSDTVYRTICAGARFDTLGRHFYDQGVYTHQTRGPDSCYHNLVINITVTDTLRDTVRCTICAGTSFDTLGRHYRNQGVFTHQTRGSDSCYHNLVIDITLTDTIRDTVYRTLPAGAHFDTNGHRYYLPGIYTQRYREADSCYHNLVINIVVGDTLRDTVRREICAGQSFDTNGERYTRGGVYTQRVRGADSLYRNLVIILTVHDTFRHAISGSICEGDVYQCGGQSFSTHGQHIVSLSTVHGCDSVIVLNLSVHDTFRDTVYPTICAGQTFTIGDSSYATQGEYTQYYTTRYNCDSVIVVRLTVFDTYRIVLNPVICVGDTFVCGDSAYTSAGVFRQLHRTANGCDSLIVINLVVRDTLRDTVHPVICKGQHFDTLGEQLFTTGYHTIRHSVGNCRHNLVVHLVANDTFRDTLYETVCAGRVYTIGDSSYYLQGVFPQYLQTVHGCDSIIVLALTVSDTLRDTVDRVICRGERFDTNGLSYTQTGVFAQRYRAPDTCFNTLVINLRVLDTYHLFFDTTFCAGSSFVYHDSVYDRQGSYVQLVRYPDRCDIAFVDINILDTLRDTVQRTVCAGASFDTVNHRYYVQGVYNLLTRDSLNRCLHNLRIELTVNDTLRDTVHRTVCAGASFDTIGQQYYNQGVYTQLLQDPVSQCYRNLVVDLVVNDTLRDTVHRTICAGASFDTNGQQYTSQGVYTQLLQDPVSRCFRNLVIDLVVDDTIRDTVRPVICAGETYDTNGVYYNRTGVYTQHLADPVTHCLQNLVVMLTVNDTFRDTLHPVICQGLYYVNGNDTMNSTGVYTKHYTTQHGCDSVIVIDLVVFDSVFDTVRRTICAGATFDTLGQRLYLQDVYHFTIPDNSPCGQHQLAVFLTVVDTLRDTIYRTISAGASFDTNGRRYFLQGVYTQRLRDTVNHCFNNLVIDLSVLDTLRDTVYRTVCAGASFDTLGQSYYLPGEHRQYNRDSITGVFSNLVIYLSVLDTLRDTVYRTVCAGVSFDTNGQSFYMPGMFTQHLREPDSCYHNLVVDITVNDTLRDTVYRTVCAGASFDTNGQSFYLPGVFTQHLRQPDSCYNNLVVFIDVLDTLRDTIYRTICAGQTFDTNNRSYARRGVYTQYLRDPITRCYNDLVIFLTVNDTFRDHIYDTVCAGAPTSHNGIYYYLPGTHLQRYQTVLGCDSIVAIHLTVRDTLRDTVYRDVCAGASFDTNGVRYYIQGIYTQHLRDSISECFHNLVIDLTVRDTIRTHVYDTVCEGETYRFNSVYYTTTGVYRYMMRTREGCDSITYLHLQVNPVAMNRVYDTCYTGYYPYADTVYTQPGVYRHMFQRVGTGCDSMVILHLKFCDSILTVLYDTTCNDSVYRFGDSVLTSSGVYYRVLMSYKGCDSIIELHLKVVDYPIARIVDSGNYCRDGIATLKLLTNGNDITWTAFPYDSTLAGQEHSQTIYVSPKRYTQYTVVVDSVPRVRTCKTTLQRVLNKASVVKAAMRREPMETDMNNLQTTFIDISTGNVVYRDWLFHETSPMAIDKHYEYDSIVWFTPLAESDSFRVRLAVRNDAGCTDTVTNIYPILKADIWVPNAFTPDEKLNTMFKVGAYNLAEFEIYIYSRAGLLVFHSTDLDDSWDGTYKGQPCIPGSYVYVINYKTNTHPKQSLKKVGSVLLIR